MRLITFLLATVLFAPETLRAQLSVVVDNKERPVTGQDLAAYRRDTATMVFHGSAPLKYEGYLLSDVLGTAGVRSDSLRSTALSMRLVIEAGDGYRIVLALSDLDPALGARRILLADRVDGHSLPPDEAPWRLIVVGDQRPSRSARQVVRIRVLSEPR